MKAYSVILGIVAACTAFPSAWARPATHSEWDNDDADSTVAVIAWFNKRDTMTYWINESSWNSWKYFADGWPSEVLSQTETMLMGQGKLKQTFIAWETRSVGNPEK